MYMEHLRKQKMEKSYKDFVRKYWWLFLAGFALVVFILVIATYNSMVRHEEGILAEDSKTEISLGAGYKKMGAHGLAFDKYRDLFLAAIREGMSGRFGKDGARGAMLWIQESNPNLDLNVIAGLQDAIDVTFNRFEAAQNAKIDKIRVYASELRTFPTNIIAGAFGFPKIDLSEVRKVVSSSEAKEAMETKELPSPEF